MKKQFIDTLRIGDTVNDIFVLAEKSLAQKKDGNNFLNITLSDKSGRVKGVVWDNVEDIAANFASGDIVHIEGNINEYKGLLQLTVKKMGACPADSIDPGEFLPATSRDVDGMFERLLKITDAFETGPLKALLEAFWHDETFVHQFKTAPAAKKMHHAYIGGLLEHTLSMVTLADKIARHYNGIDREMLIAGTILHDIGKIKEFEYKFRIDYSDEGRLLNHIIIGIEMIDNKLKYIDGFPEDQAMLLKHMVISHHGAKEFGSPEPPKTIEAVLLNYIDEIDSKVNGIRNFMAAEDTGEAWTSYHRIWERHFYRGKQ
jgi:3'-5' exoribonuclease